MSAQTTPNRPNLLSLRLRIKTNAALSRFLRSEARRLRDRARKAKNAGTASKLYSMVNQLRLDAEAYTSDSRILNLALGFLKGREYKSLEAKCAKAPNLSEMAQAIVRTGHMSLEDAKASLKLWLEGTPSQEILLDNLYREQLIKATDLFKAKSKEIERTNETIKSAQSQLTRIQASLDGALKDLQAKEQAALEAKGALDTLTRQGPPSRQLGDPLANLRSEKAA